MAKQPNSVNFEKSLQELETIVEKMESADLPLEEALSHFEKGIGLTKTCQQALDEAEQKIRVMTEKTKDDNEL